jgi:cytochrome c biogenesis protein CcmG, thiol:disulfide interchange protein DsbE
VLLNLWATWCKPCREEIPALDRLHREFGSTGLAVVGASLDDEAGSAEVEDFARRLGASYAIWIDAEDRIAGSFRPVGVPTTYLIDRDGVIRWRHVGPVKSDDAGLREALARTLPR